MTWRVNIPPDIQQQVWALPGDGRDSVLSLIDDLRADPHKHTEKLTQYDDGPVRMHTAAKGLVLATVTINDTTGVVTFMKLTTAH
ncbi:type II toxin-antitoxin system RelE family toxin [Streptomyces albus]|uniref:type II toxin-antitoxin system RelE family toxin n=1 Tax=Streptomyces albus TaxID=1888 RepID=UPI0033CA485D